MGRKIIERDLPDLNTVFRAFKGFDDEQNQTQLLGDMLKKLALDVQKDEPRPFYSLRQIAQFFDVPYATVARVYKRLHEEGILIRLRGSVTLVQPKKAQPRKPVHGVVGVPIWLYGFVYFNDWRYFYFKLEEHLRRHGLVADFVFFNVDEASHPDLGERMLQHNLDYLVWFIPEPPSIPLMQRLDDGGVRVITLTPPRHQFPFYTYHLSWQQGFQQLLRTWAQEGVREVIVFHTAADLEYVPMLKELMRQQGIRTLYSDTILEPESVKPVLEDHPQAAVMLLDVHRSERLTVLTDLPAVLRRRKSAVCNLLDLDKVTLKGIKVDTVMMDWDAVAKRISDDIVSGRIYQTREPVTLEAVFLRNVNAGSLGAEM